MTDPHSPACAYCHVPFKAVTSTTFVFILEGDPPTYLCWECFVSLRSESNCNLPVPAVSAEDMSLYQIKVIHDDGQTTWLHQIYVNGKIDTARDRKDALILDGRAADHFLECITADHATFRKVLATIPGQANEGETSGASPSNQV